MAIGIRLLSRQSPRQLEFYLPKPATGKGCRFRCFGRLVIHLAVHSPLENELTLSFKFIHTGFRHLFLAKHGSTAPINCRKPHPVAAGSADAERYTASRPGRGPIVVAAASRPEQDLVRPPPAGHRAARPLLPHQVINLPGRDAPPRQRRRGFPAAPRRCSAAPRGGAARRGAVGG